MTETRGTWTPDVPLAPGETIKEILEERAIQQVDFATRLGKSQKFVSQLVNGKAPITHETAIELERVLGVPAAFWNAAEATYRDLLARQEATQHAGELAEWVHSFPVKEMERRGWIARETGAAGQSEELLSFFGVSSVEAYEAYWRDEKRLAARMSTGYSADTAALAAWLRAGERAAESVRTAPYNAQRFRAVLNELREATRLSPDKWQPLMVASCAAAGVAVVFVPELSKTSCYGVSWWASRTRAVIQLGLRGRTDDQLWFSFFHEAGHLLLDDRNRTGINDLDGTGETEDRANAFAGDLLVPPAEYATFLQRSGRPTKAEVASFAGSIGIAASIVVGRLQRDGVIPYSWMRDLKTALDWE